MTLPDFLTYAIALAIAAAIPGPGVIAIVARALGAVGVLFCYAAATHDAATAAALAHGFTVPDAVAFAKDWVSRALAAAYPLGAGHGPVNPLWRVNER